MSMRTFVASLALTAVLLQPVSGSAREVTQAEEALFGVAALATNIVYVSAKIIVATGGLLLGSLVGLGTGGDTRSAYAVWVPAATGTYVLNAANVDGSEPIEFFGSAYADEPSPLASTESGEGGSFYRALYE